MRRDAPQVNPRARATQRDGKRSTRREGGPGASLTRVGRHGARVVVFEQRQRLARGRHGRQEERGERTGGRLVTGGGRVEGQAIKAMHVGCRRSDGGLWRRVNGRTEQDGESVLQQSPWLSLQRMDGWMDGWRRCLARDSQKPAARTWTKRSLGLTLFTLCLLARPGRPVG